jgi:hypothetical protein
VKIGIIEFGGEFSRIFQKEVEAKIGTATFQTKTALDLFDVLAFARKMVTFDHVAIIAEISPEEREKNTAFYNGLASLEAETGKNIFKYIYEEGEADEEEIKKFAEKFVNSLFPEKKEE